MSVVPLHRDAGLVSPDVVRAEIEAAQTVHEVVALLAKADGLRAAAALVDRSGVLARDFAEASLRAQRRAGELLADEAIGKGRKSVTLTDLGVTANQSSRWQRIASVPDNEFDAYVADAFLNSKELTQSGLLKLAKRLSTTPVDDAQPTPTATAGEGRFPTIVIDPPWRYDNVATRGAAEDHYQTMSLDDLAALDIPAADNAHIYLWVTNGFIREGFTLLDAWGFTYKTTLTWCKPQIGMGNWFRNATEHVLFGVRGKLPTQRNDVPTWFTADRTRHSAKPERFYDLVESCSPSPWFEMFSRRKRLGDWHVWGNESMTGGVA